MNTVKENMLKYDSNRITLQKDFYYIINMQH